MEMQHMCACLGDRNRGVAVVDVQIDGLIVPTALTALTATKRVADVVLRGTGARECPVRRRLLLRQRIRRGERHRRRYACERPRRQSSWCCRQVQTPPRPPPPNHHLRSS